MPSPTITSSNATRRPLFGATRRAGAELTAQASEAHYAKVARFSSLLGEAPALPSLPLDRLDGRYTALARDRFKGFPEGLMRGACHVFDRRNPRGQMRS